MEKETLMDRSETTLDNHALTHFEMRLSLQQHQRHERTDDTDDIPVFRKGLLQRESWSKASRP